MAVVVFEVNPVFSAAISTPPHSRFGAVHTRPETGMWTYVLKTEIICERCVSETFARDMHTL